MISIVSKAFLSQLKGLSQYPLLGFGYLINKSNDGLLSRTTFAKIILMIIKNIIITNKI